MPGRRLRKVTVDAINTVHPFTWAARPERSGFVKEDKFGVYIALANGRNIRVRSR